MCVSGKVEAKGEKKNIIGFEAKQRHRTTGEKPEKSSSCITFSPHQHMRTPVGGK